MKKTEGQRATKFAAYQRNFGIWLGLLRCRRMCNPHRFFTVTRTRHKLNEAEFFLSKLVEHYFDQVRCMLEEKVSPPVFSYYLSAFVSAARSVTWVMRHEYSRIPDWEGWFRAQDLTESERGLLKLFNELRVRSEKLEPLPLGHSIRLVGDPDAPQPDPGLPRCQIIIRRADDESQEVVLAGEIAAFEWTLKELEDRNLLQACRDYTALLAGLVQDCEKRFTANDSKKT